MDVMVFSSRPYHREYLGWAARESVHRLQFTEAALDGRSNRNVLQSGEHLADRR